MKIAVASSGLGHVARGIETWAMDTAQALAKGGVDVTLFAGGIDDSMQRSQALSLREDNGLSDGAPPKQQIHEFTNQRIIALPCLRRFQRTTATLVCLAPGWTWRWGLKAGYGWEQFTFWWRLWPKLRKGRYDILHVQDPMLAFWCRKFRRLGLVETKEILAHGTEEPPEWIAQFDYVQHLAPYHLRSAESWSMAEANEQTDEASKGQIIESTSPYPFWVSIPNFVDTEIFRPIADEAEKKVCRERLGIPTDAFVIGTVATVKKPHKRIDYLIREFSRFEHSNALLQHSSTPTLQSPLLLIAGAGTPQSGELVSMADKLAPGGIKFCFDLPRERMPDLYRTLDVFVLSSVFEMMPIAVLESLASGIPVVANRIPQLEWMVGEGVRCQETGVREDSEVRSPCSALSATKGKQGSGDRREVADDRAQAGDGCSSAFSSQPSALESGGACIDMGRDGALAELLGGLTPEWIMAKGAAARKRALEAFSKDVVIWEYIDYYRRVLEK